MKVSFGFTVFSVLLAWSSVSYSNAGDLDKRQACGQGRALVLSSVAEFLPAEQSFFTNGLFSGDGLDFQRNVMSRSPEEISLHRASAINYFQEKFGININSPSIFFNGFEVMPEIEYHVMLDSKKEGFRHDEIQDGGWIAVVVDVNGLALGGDFSGVTVPQGTMFVFGDYKINHRNKSDVIAYKSNKPFIPQFDGSFIASFDVQGKNSSGKAIATISPKLSENGLMTANIKNVLQLESRCQ